MIINNYLDIRHCDNMELMAEYKDNHFDLTIVDPPYGIGIEDKNSKRELKSNKSATRSNDYGNQNWDNNTPLDDYFCQLKRVSKRQIIWGANFFNLKGGMLYWHKNVTMPTYSSGELAYLSWLNKVEYVEITWHGMLQQNMKDKEHRIHPTQKPVALYKWLLKNYAKEGDKILDTHLGSGSIAIAVDSMNKVEKMDLTLTACELDVDYYNDSIKRIKNQTKQLSLI